MEVVNSLLPDFRPSSLKMASSTEKLAHTPLNKMEWLRENLDMSLKLVSPY
jgi:hypothetical protein